MKYLLKDTNFILQFNCDITAQNQRVALKHRFLNVCCFLLYNKRKQIPDILIQLSVLSVILNAILTEVRSYMSLIDNKAALVRVMVGYRQ